MRAEQEAQLEAQRAQVELLSAKEPKGHCEEQTVVPKMSTPTAQLVQETALMQLAQGKEQAEQTG